MSITTTLSKIQINYLVKFLILLTLATGAPMLGFHSQWITGPIVNMTLILSVFLIDIRGAVLIGLLPSTIALGTGLLSPALAPMVPFIIISNVILILIIDKIVCRDAIYRVSESEKDAINGVSTKKYFAGLIMAAGLKFLFLFLTSNLVIRLLLNQKLATTVAQMMSWPQFYTALIGGILTFGVLKNLKK